MPEQPKSASSSGAAERDDAPTVISKTAPGGNGTRLAQADLIRGQRLAHFELIEPIGVGGMAAVLRARDTQLDRIVALKVLPPDMANEPENLLRFENEAKAAARLDHENIARVYYFGRDQGLHFIAFEFVEGKNLKELIAEQGRIPIPQAVHYVLQIAQGLAHAAQRGVVHRDIKPSNIIVGENGRAKLVDMGLARSTDLRLSESLTQSGVTLGTFDYISPEQAIEPRQADCRSDIYSLGCTLYHMLTGVPPVPEGTVARKLQFHQNELPLDPRQLNPEIPDELAAILARMMAKDPKDRYQHPEELVADLAALSLRWQSPGGSLPSVEAGTLERLLPRQPASRPWWVLLTGLAAVVLLVGVVLPLAERQSSRGQKGAQANSDADTPTRQPGSPSERPGELPTGRTGDRPGGTSIVSRPLEPPLEADAVEVQSLSELLSALLPRHVRTIRWTGGVLELPGDRRGPKRSVTVADGDFTFEGGNGQRPVLRLRAGLGAGEADPPLGFVLSSGIATFRGWVFEIEPGLRGDPAVLFSLAGGQLVLEDCEFRTVGEAEGRSAVVHVPRRPMAGDRGPAVFFKRCLLRGGDAAIVLEEGAHVSMEDCLAGPYEQPLVLRARDRSPHRLRSSISVQSCSWLLGSGPWLTLESQQPCQISVTRSVFSQPVPWAESAWLSVASRQLASVRLSSGQNYFHNLAALLAVRKEDESQERLVASPAEWARAGASWQDVGSQSDRLSPWELRDPLLALAEGNATEAARLHQRVRQVLGDTVGVRRLLGKEVYPPTAVAGPPSIAQPPAPKQFIVDGQGNKPGTYKTLASALGDADAEEELVVAVRVHGLLPIRSLDVGSRKVTIRAEEGFWPELTFNPEQVPTGDGEAVLFRIHDGELTLENVSLRLNGLREREATRLQVFVSVSGTGKVRLRNCVATLEEEAAPHASLIALADPTGAMMGSTGKPPRPGQPWLELDNCLVRGAGDLLYVRASRPFQLDLRNVLAVLEGSLVTVDGNRPEASLTGEGVSVTLDRVTAYVSETLIHLRASANFPVHVPLRVVSATNCLFVAAMGNALLRIEGPQSEEDLRRRFSWQGKGNVYSVSGPLLVWQPLPKEEMPHRYPSERWSELWGRGEEQAVFDPKLRFANAPAPGQHFSQAKAADFRLEGADSSAPDLVGRGADLGLLPRAILPVPLVP
jgi:serine/threonine protein kinase